jgi:hypothetical protein
MHDKANRTRFLKTQIRDPTVGYQMLNSDKLPMVHHLGMRMNRITIERKLINNMAFKYFKLREMFFYNHRSVILAI